MGEQERSGGKKRGAEDEDDRSSWKAKKGDSKGKKGDSKGGKGGGKGGKKDAKNKQENQKYKTLRAHPEKYGIELKTKEGVPRCHRFGSGLGCRTSDCSYSHTCAKCGESHPTVSCPQLRGAI